MLSFRSFFKKIIEQNKQINHLLFLLFDWFLIVFKVPNPTVPESDLSVVDTTKEKYILNIGYTILFVDYIHTYILSIIYSVGNPRKTTLVFDKIQQLDNNNFYKFNNKNTLFSTQQLFLYGCRSVWKHLRFWILPILFFVGFIYFSFFLKSLPFSKIFAGYLLLGFL